jgi:hypothetical protein
MTELKFIYGFFLALLGNWLFACAALFLALLILGVVMAWRLAQGLWSRLRDWWPVAESILVPATILAAVLLAGGCTGILMADAARQGKDLTPEQIKAYNEIGSAVYGCFQIGGPPPAGNTVWIIVPKGTEAKFHFADNCHLINQ